MADDAFYMKKALEEARRAYEEDEIPVGAVVVCGDRILARAQFDGDTDGCYGTCRDAGDYGRR